MGLLTSLLGNASKAKTVGFLGASTVAGAGAIETGGLMASLPLPKASRGVYGSSFEHGEGSMFVGLGNNPSSFSPNSILNTRSSSTGNTFNSSSNNSGLSSISNDMNSLSYSASNFQALIEQNMELMQSTFSELLEKLSQEIDKLGEDDNKKKEKQDDFFQTVKALEQGTSKFFELLSKMSN